MYEPSLLLVRHRALLRVCACMHIHACPRTHTRARLHAHAHTHTCTHAHTHEHTHTCAHTHAPRTRAHTHTHTHTHTQELRQLKYMEDHAQMREDPTSIRYVCIQCPSLFKGERKQQGREWKELLECAYPQLVLKRI